MIDAFLKAAGYSDQVPDPLYHNDGVVYWYKRVPETNHHQVVVRKWPKIPLNVAGDRLTKESYEVEMTYETRNGIWATTKFYGLGEEELVEELHRLESCMKQALLYMDANPMHYQFRGDN